MTTSINYAVVEYTTAKHFCNVYDAVAIEHLEWELVSYDREKRVHLDRASASIPMTRCNVLLPMVLSGLHVPGWNMEVFGGSVRDGGIESPLFNVAYDPGADGTCARFPFRVSLSIGPGKRTATGGIAPDGKPTTSMSMRVPEDDVLGICLEVRDFLLIHQRDVETVRRTDQNQRYQARTAA